MRRALIIVAMSLFGCKNPLVVKEYLNLVSISPNHGATQVAMDVQLIAGFSEPLVPASVNSQTAYLSDADSSPVVATATYEAGAHWIVINPETDLQPNTTYVVTFTPDIEGEVTGNLLAPVQTRFTTAGSHPSNALPNADAGADQTVSIGQTATLDGSASEDLEDAVLSFSWRLVSAPANSAVTLSTATATMVREDMKAAVHGKVLTILE